jgi:hypothetical protein
MMEMRKVGIGFREFCVFRRLNVNALNGMVLEIGASGRGLKPYWLHV